jgi:hypothetical protein
MSWLSSWSEEEGRSDLMPVTSPDRQVTTESATIFTPDAVLLFGPLMNTRE